MREKEEEDTIISDKLSSVFESVLHMEKYKEYVSVWRIKYKLSSKKNAGISQLMIELRHIFYITYIMYFSLIKFQQNIIFFYKWISGSKVHIKFHISHPLN